MNLKEKHIFTNKNSLRDHWENIKLTNVHTIWVPEEEERKKGTKHLLNEITASLLGKVI